MRFLADESCDVTVVRAPREAGHDVVAICEEQPGLTDQDVMMRAAAEGCVVVTEDKDFGRLVFSAGAGTVGCVLVRFPARARGSLGSTVVRIVEELAGRIQGAFVTVEPGHIRITRLHPR